MNRIAHTIEGQPAGPTPEQRAAMADMQRRVEEAKRFLASGTPLTPQDVRGFLTQYMSDAESQRSYLAEQLKVAEATGNAQGMSAVLTQAMSVKRVIDHCAQELAKLPQITEAKPGANGKAR